MTDLKCFTQKDIIDFLKSEIAGSGLNQKGYAKKIDVLPTFLNEVLSGRRNPSEKMSKRFGWHKTTVWTGRSIAPNEPEV